MKSKQERHTPTERISAMKILERNNFNFLKIAKLTGVSRSTLKRWKGLYGKEVFSGETPSEKVTREVEIEMRRNDARIIEKYYRLRDSILDQISELVPRETKIEALSNVLKNVSAEMGVFDDLDKKEKFSSGQPNLVEIINNQLKAQREGAPCQNPPDFDSDKFDEIDEM